MVLPGKFKIAFKTISALMAGIFLWNQIAFAGDLIDAALEQQYKDQSQTFAPSYLQNQQSAAESIISQKQAIEDTISAQNLMTSTDTQPPADESIDLKGPRGDSGGEAMANNAAMQTSAQEITTSSQNGAVLSVTTQAGDIIHYKEGRIEEIETKDSEGGKIIIKRITGQDLVDVDNNLINAEIRYADGTMQMVTNGKVSKITKPDNTIVNYDAQERIADILYPDGKTVTFSYGVVDTDGNIVTVLTDSEKTSYYDSNNRLKRIAFSDEKIIEYDSGVISKITEADLSQHIFEIKTNLDSTITSNLSQYVAPDGTVYRYALNESNVLTSITVEKNGIVATYNKDGALVSVTKDGQSISSETIVQAQADYDAALAIYQQKELETQSYQASLNNANTDLTNKTAAKDAAQTALNAAVQNLNNAQSVKDAKQILYTTAYNDFIAAQSAYDAANTALNTAKAAETQASQNLTNAQNTLAAKQTILNNKIAARQVIQTTIINLNNEIQSDQTALLQAQQSLNTALAEEQTAQTEYNNTQADVNTKQIAYDNAVQDRQVKEAAFNTANTNLINAQQAKTATENALSTGGPYIISSYTFSNGLTTLNQYENFINDQFDSYNSNLWYKPADTLVAIGSGVATLKGTGKNYNATFYSNQSYSRTDKPVLSTTFKVSSASGRFIAALDGYTSSNAYRRVGIYVYGGRIYLQIMTGNTASNKVTLVSTAKTNTNYTVEFEVTPEAIKVYLWESTAQRPVNPSYTYIITDWTAVRPYYSLYSGMATIDYATMRSPNYNSMYDSNSQLVKDVYQNGNTSIYSYSPNAITVSDYKEYLDSPYNFSTTGLWYKPADSLVTIDNGIATLKGTGLNYNTTFYSNQTFQRADNLTVKSTFQDTSTSGNFIAAVDGYNSSNAYRRVGIVIQSGRIYVQTMSGNKTSTPKTLISTAKANTNYNVEFEVTSASINIYLWESSAQRPTSPSYTYTVTDWTTVRPYFSIYSGQATVSNEYINYNPQVRIISSTSSEYSQILTRNQLVRNLNNAISNVNTAQAVYNAANTALNNAKATEAQARQNLTAAQTTLAAKQTTLNNKIAARQAIQTTKTNLNAEIQSDQTALTQAQQSLNAALAEEQAAQTEYNNAQTDVNTRQAAYNSAVQDRQAKEAALNTTNANLTAKTTAKNQANANLQAAIQNLANAQTAKDAAQAAYNSAYADYLSTQTVYDQSLTNFDNAKSEEDIAKAQADLLLAALNTLLSISSLFPAQDTILQNANNKLNIINVLYDVGRHIKQVHQMDGATQDYINGLPGTISNGSLTTLYSYDLNALDNVNRITVDRDGIKRIYDKYGNIKSLSLDDATEVVYENGQVKEIHKADGTTIKQMTFSDSGELDKALVSYPDGSLAVYDDAELLQLISASGDITDYNDGKIRKVTLENGTVYDWSYDGSDIIILDNAKEEKRTYFEGRLLQLEELTGAKLITKYYYDDMSKNLIKSEICKKSEILYTYTYNYENDLTFIHDEDGNTQAYTKDKKLSYIIDSTGKKYSYTYVGKSEGYIEVYFPSGTKVRYDSNSRIVDVTKGDGAVIKEITFDQNNNPINFIYIKDETVYKVINGKITEIIAKDGTDTLYYDNGFIKSIQGQIADSLEEYQYYITDAKTYKDASFFQPGTPTNVSYYINNNTATLQLSDATLKFGTGLDGVKHVTANETLTAGTYNFTSLTIDAGKTLTIASGTVIKVLGTLAVNGTIAGTGTSDISAYTVTVTSTGAITTNSHIIADTLNNYGTMKYDAVSTLTHDYNGSSYVDYGSGANTIDGDTLTYYGNYARQAGGGTTMSYLYSQHTGVATDYNSFYWKIYLLGQTNAGASANVAQIYAYLQVQQNGTWNTIQSYGNGAGGNQTVVIDQDEIITSSQSAVTGVRVYLVGYAYQNGGGGGQYTDNHIYEFKAYANPVCEYINSSGSVPPSAAPQPQYPSSGTFESNVIELNALELDKISWSQVTPSGTQITFQTRTGSTATPDDTWSDWSGPMTDPGGSQITSMAGKYLQYRINMSTNDTAISPKVMVDSTHGILISYIKFSDNLSDAYVKVKEGNITKAYNGSGVLIWEEDVLGNRTTYDPSNPQDTIDLLSLKFDSTAIDTFKEALPAYKLSDGQKVITVYDKGNDIPIEMITAGQSVTYFDSGLATKVVDKNGTTLVLYTYDENKDVIKVDFVDARQKLEESYQKALSEIVTEKAAALAKLAKAEADARADIITKSADIQLQIDAERDRITREQGKYDPSIYDLSAFARAFAELDDYQVKLNQQKIDAEADATNQVAAARARIEQDAQTAMKDLVDNDYNKILSDIVQKESMPLIYQYYRKVLGRDPGNDDLLYWTDFAKANLRAIAPAELTQHLQSLPEYAQKQARKQNIINNLTAFFAQYLAAPQNEEEIMLNSLGIAASEAVLLTQDDIDKILAYLNGQSLHFGDSAFEAVVSMLKASGINKSFDDIGKDALKIDILTGVITKDTVGDLVISMFAMRNAAQANGLTLYTEKVTYDDLKDKVSRNNVIVHIDGKHYVTIKTINDSEGTVTYIDHTVGATGQDITVSRAEFMESWKGYVLSKELTQDESKHINATREKNIRGSGWWEDFWEGIVNFFQDIVAPVAVILLMIPPLAPIGAVLLGINIVIQTISFVVRTGTLMDVVWSVVTAIGAAIGSQILPNILDAASNVFSSIGHAIFAPLQGVFSSVMPIFNNLSTAVANIATGIGQIISFGTAATPQIAASIGYNIINQGISLGTSFMFKAMNLDPTFTSIGSALLTGAIMGAITPNTDIVTQALKYGTIAGVEEVGRATDLDPNVTHLAAMTAGALVGGSITTGDGKTLSYDQIAESIKLNMLSEAGYIGVTKIGELLGIDSRISYLAGVGIRSTINAGLTHEFMPDVIWGSVQNGLLRGITSVALQWGAEELGLSPLIGSLTSAAIAGGLEALLMGQNPVQGIFDTYFRAGIGLLTLGGDGGNNPWLRAAYISQVLDFSQIVQDRGIVNALETYSAGFLHQQTINEIWKQGGIAELLTKPNQIEITTNRKGETVKRIYTMDITTESDKLISNYIDLSPTYDMLVGFREGNVITHCEFVVGPDGKPQLKNGEREVWSADGSYRIEYVENFNLNKIDYIDKYGTRVGYYVPTAGTYSIVTDANGKVTSGKFISLITDYSVSTKDNQVTNLSLTRDYTFSETQRTNLLNAGYTEQDLAGFKEVASIVNGVLQYFVIPPNTPIFDVNEAAGKAWLDSIEADGRAFWQGVYGLLRDVVVGDPLPQLSSDSVYPYANIELNLVLPGRSEGIIAGLDLLNVVTGNVASQIGSLITSNSTWNHNTGYSAQLYSSSFDMGYKLVFGGGAKFLLSGEGSNRLDWGNLNTFYSSLNTTNTIGVGFSADTVSIVKSWLIPNAARADHYFLLSPQLSPKELEDFMRIGGISPDMVTVVETSGDFPKRWLGSFSDNTDSNKTKKWNYVKIVSGPDVSLLNPFSSHGVPVRGVIDGGQYIVEVNGIRSADPVSLADIYSYFANRNSPN